MNDKIEFCKTLSDGLEVKGVAYFVIASVDHGKPQWVCDDIEFSNVNIEDLNQGHASELMDYLFSEINAL